jgi:ABC-type oligopeptide transport system substrate-binding subunit
MGSRKMLMTTAMVALLALPLAACSSTAKIRSSRLCTAAGGTYSGNTCNPGTPNQKGAKQMCDAHGGVYDSVLDMCEMPGDK